MGIISVDNFGLEIKRLRLEKGLTQVQLAEKIRITQGAVASLESGRKTGVATETLYLLSDALGVSADHWRPFLAAGDAGANVRTPDKPKKKPKGK